MSLFSIVARDNFISIVLDCEESYAPNERTMFREIIPNQSFLIYTGPVDLGVETWELVKTLSFQGVSLKEIALIIHQQWQMKTDLTINTEAVIGGISENGKTQYHIITAEEEVQSFYPKKDESLYYANDVPYQLDTMDELTRTLMMKGMSSIKQAQKAQYKLYETFAGVRPGTSSRAHFMVLKNSSDSHCSILG
ncbi:hypothetical protein [Mesobacillus maritimus]|uniref:Uncharacterized protein n=1 Tax=Mesobacillus maritimus TaxID=1643336 RepID=A0ABS7K1G0_9BACI|nr:hypothetical protein [Mesobacillus maritimus]MBY0096077.1 hypothetical protein [Mesobacillus maritimus]